MIHADEREEDNSPLPERPQEEEIPRRDPQRRVASDKVREIPISEIEISKPMEIPTREEILQKEINQFRIEDMQKDMFLLS